MLQHKRWWRMFLLSPRVSRATYGFCAYMAITPGAGLHPKTHPPTLTKWSTPSLGFLSSETSRFYWHWLWSCCSRRGSDLTSFQSPSPRWAKREGPAAVTRTKGRGRIGRTERCGARQARDTLAALSAWHRDKLAKEQTTFHERGRVKPSAKGEEKLGGLREREGA